MELRGDRPNTYRITFICLAIGVGISAVVGLLLLSLRQPLSVSNTGSVTLSVGAFMIPLAGLISIAILIWSVFFLPVSMARRWGILLDPNVWPATGAIAVGVLVVIAFMAGILLGVI